uniref:Papilin n=1 Tax=Monodelphis domestica TaxID=13616 RepID=A0A5F8G3E5_MONDO
MQKCLLIFLLSILHIFTLVFLFHQARKVRRQNENWGHWGEWSQCSRTCGGGVSFQERHCYSQRIDGSSSCIGPTRNYRSCNTESCPQGTRDFRAEQCAEFDGKEFQGKKYKWFPYYGAANKCELNCIPKGENFYYRHKEAVVDGTPCEPGKLDICVQGTCQAVGCDHVLYSSKKEDKCLRCGGDGQTCYPVKGTFDANDLTKGYNQILIIPAGATSIHIAEVTASRNFLAVKNVRGEYYLNGHWTIEFGRALPVASTILQYERGSEGDLAPEHLRARGPTSEPLVIELISQEPNPGVQYEYYLPHWPLDTGFTWSHGSWSDCSAECGGGYQTRLVFCTTINEVYPDHMCRHKPQPSDNRTCNLQACPQTKRWKTGPWTACSAPCGGGSQSRHVYCVVSDGAGMEEATDEASCSALPGRPPSTQSCNLHRCAAWSSGPWGECSASCGPGVRSRTVTCWGDEGSALQDFACSSADKPPLTEACMGENCPLQEPGWHIGDWGLCSKSCDSGIRKRQVICADRDSNVYSSDLCQARQPQMPAEVEACNTQSCHLPQEVPSIHGSPRAGRSCRCIRQAGSKGISCFLCSLGGREEWWLHRNQPPSEHSREGHGGSNLLPQHQESGWRSSGSRQYHQQRDPVSRPQPPDCRHSLHGCCPDGHTVAPGPLGRGCPRISCQQSTYGCCPDGVSSALGRNHAGCPRSHDETHVNRHGPRAASSPSRPDPSVECRGSRYGCCYDNSASSTGPLGEGCQGRPSSPYPVRCLLPSAHGSCADWTPRWYFIPTVGKCNRFWYGGCHGNRNNFLSEEECMKSCHEGAEDSVTGPLTHGAERGWASPSQREIGTPLVPASPGKLDGSLAISSVSEEDAGTYTCSTSVGGQDSSRQVQLWITGHLAMSPPVGFLVDLPCLRPLSPWGRRYKREFSHEMVMLYRLSFDRNQPGVVDANIGQRVQLPCRTSGYPPPVIEWQKDGQPLSSPRHQQQPDGSLLISRVSREDGGFYTCIAFNQREREQRWVQLRILGRELKIVGLEPAVTVPEGGDTELHCVVLGDDVNVRWSRNGVPLRGDGYRIHLSQDGTLVINNTRARDEGSYTCSAYSGSQAVSRSTEVKVVYPRPPEQPRDPSRECIDQPELANCDLILQAQLCGNEYYSSFCCASCSRYQPQARPVWQQG